MVRTDRVFLVLLFVGCSSQTARTNPSISADSVAILRTYDSVLTQVIGAPDPASATDAYLRFHTADAVLMIPGIPPVAGRDSIRAFLLGFFKGYRFQYPEWHTAELVVSGDWAFHRYSGIALTIPRAGGRERREDRKYLDVWHREPTGAWRIARHVFNLNR